MEWSSKYLGRGRRGRKGEEGGGRERKRDEGRGRERKREEEG